MPPDPHLLVRKPKPHATPGDPARQGGSARSHPELQPVRIWHLNNRENHPSHIDRELELGETRWGEREMMTPPREGFLGERAGSSNSCSIRQPLLHQATLAPSVPQAAPERPTSGPRKGVTERPLWQQTEEPLNHLSP